MVYLDPSLAVRLGQFDDIAVEKMASGAVLLTAVSDAVFRPRNPTHLAAALRIQAALARSGIGVTIVARPGIAVEVIDTVWREFDAGLVVMASHGNTGIASSFLGSVAARVIEEVLRGPEVGPDGRIMGGVYHGKTVAECILGQVSERCGGYQVRADA